MMKSMKTASSYPSLEPCNLQLKLKQSDVDLYLLEWLCMGNSRTNVACCYTCEGPWHYRMHSLVIRSGCR